MLTHSRSELLVEAATQMEQGRANQIKSNCREKISEQLLGVIFSSINAILAFL